MGLPLKHCLILSITIFLHCAISVVAMVDGTVDLYSFLLHNFIAMYIISARKICTEIKMMHIDLWSDFKAGLEIEAPSAIFLHP